MSLTTYQNKVSKLKSDIADLEKKLSQERTKESNKSSELTKVKRSISKKKTSSGLTTAENKANRLERELAKISTTRADLEDKVAKKTKELHRNEQYLAREQSKEDKNRRAAEIRHEKALTREVKARRHLKEMRETLSEEFPSYERQDDEIEEVTYDIFISHASHRSVGRVDQGGCHLLDLRTQCLDVVSLLAVYRLVLRFVEGRK